MGLFGHNSKGAYSDYDANLIKGAYFTCPETCTADSISVYLLYYTGGVKVKCAIYRVSDLSLVGVTEEWTVTAAFDDWHVFNFSSPPTLANEDYILVLWNNGIVYSYYDYPFAVGRVQGLAYDGFPNPLVPSNNSNKVSIYCTYTPLAAGQQLFTLINEMGY